MNRAHDFRRTGHLRLVPIFAAAIAGGFLVGPRVGGPLLVVFGLLIIVFLTEGATKVSISGDVLSVGVGSRRSDIRSSGVVSCKYHPVVFTGRWVQFASLEIRDSPDEVGLILPTTGWGKSRPDFLRTVREWLAAGDVTLDSRTARVLDEHG